MTDLRIRQLRFEAHPRFTMRDAMLLISGGLAATSLGFFIAWLQGTAL